jgi:hypothetical protein
MKIVILGKGKSGTTVLVHMVAAAFPECRPVLGGFRAHVHARSRAGSARDASFVCKFTFNDKKGRSFDAVMRHIVDEGYDKKIWLARDPRDNAVSDALFRWRGRHGKSERQYRACLELVKRKERDPRSVPFCEIFRFSGDPGGPESIEQAIAMERERYARMCEFVRGLGSDWFVFGYEDLVDGKLTELSGYLGREILPVVSMPEEDRVKARTKSYGDWCSWFTEEDVRIFAPVYEPYMELMGYDVSEWELDPSPRIDPAAASEYMRRLELDGRRRGFQGLRDGVVKIYERMVSLGGRPSA